MAGLSARRPVEGGTDLDCAFCMNIESRKRPWPACRPAGQAPLGAGQLPMEGGAGLGIESSHHDSPSKFKNGAFD
jgi:hypothetical protein